MPGTAFWFTYGIKYIDEPEAAYQECLESQQAFIKGSKELKLDRPPWHESFFRMGKSQLGSKTYALQASNFGSTNKSFGLLAIELPRFRYFDDLWEHLLGEQGLENKSLLDVFKAKFSLQKAARFGRIGLKALEPKDLEKLLFDDDSANLKKLKKKDPYELTLYKTWIIAMLNNNEIYELSIRLADALLAYRQLGKTKSSTETEKHNNTEELLKQSRKPDFIVNLAEIKADAAASNHAEHSELYTEVGKIATKQLGVEELRLFQALLKLHIAGQ